jgi:RHS repeat-associated protein
MPGFLKVLKVVFLIGCLASLSAKSVSASQTLRFLHQDHLGSTVMVTDDQGNVVSQQNYYPYGSVRNVTGSLPTEKQYTGQVSDKNETGLYYYNARYYNSTIGKFTQADLIQGPNRYLYVGNNPIKYNDPSGNESENTWQNWWTPSSNNQTLSVSQAFSPAQETGWEYQQRTGNLPSVNVAALSFQEEYYNNSKQYEQSRELWATEFSPSHPESQKYFQSVIPSGQQAVTAGEIFNRDIAWRKTAGANSLNASCIHNSAAVQMALTRVNIPSFLVDLNLPYSKDEGELSFGHRIVAYRNEDDKWMLYDQDLAVKAGYPVTYSPTDDKELREIAQLYKQIYDWNFDFSVFGLPIGGDPLNLLEDTNLSWLLKPPDPADCYNNQKNVPQGE